MVSFTIKELNEKLEVAKTNEEIENILKLINIEIDFVGLRLQQITDKLKELDGLNEILLEQTNALEKLLSAARLKKRKLNNGSKGN